MLIGTVGYLTLVILLRGTGPRTMTDMTLLGFDIAVSIGSVFGRVITAVDVNLGKGQRAVFIERD